MNTKRYRLRERLHEELVPHLLLARGIEQSEHEQFLSPQFERDSHDPFLLPDMGAAVERLISAIKQGERVCVWSDYDCDGIPGGVMLTELLRALGGSVTHYIPHRHKEGYGLNVAGIEELAAQGITLIITIDLGTTEHEQIAFAKTKGIEVIVTDHHLVHDAAHLPPALAVINPKRPDSTYPFDGLCGAGVAWKLAQAILATERFSYPEGQEKWLLDLVGIATLSDMVPLRGENRMLARFGLMVMRKNRRPGLASLLSLLKIKPAALTEDDIGFMVAPRINAASRMDSPSTAARLLAAREATQARELAQALNAINDERKGVVAATVKEANKRLADAPTPSPIIVMGNPNWRPGILGLVANSLIESHHAARAAFLWGREGGELIRGSCRSDGSVNIVELMRAAGEGLFDDFGGHTASGGFSLPQERVHELLPRLASAYETLAAAGQETPESLIDWELPLAEAPRAHRVLKELAPFGMENSKPLFLIPNARVARSRVFGKQQNHLELALEHDGAQLPGIAFFAGPDSFQKPIEPGMRADVVGHVEADWRGGSRIRIVDVL